MRSTWIPVDVILRVISPSLLLNWISIQKAKKKSMTHWRFKSFARWIKSLLAITVKKKIKKIKKTPPKNPLHNKYPGSKSFDTSVKFSLKRNSRSFYNYPYLSLIFTNTNLSTLLNFLLRPNLLLFIMTTTLIETYQPLHLWRMKYFASPSRSWIR